MPVSKRIFKVNGRIRESCSRYYSQNTKSVPLPLLYSVVIYCTLFCFSVARSDLFANIATIVFEMICFDKVSVSFR